MCHKEVPDKQPESPVPPESPEILPPAPSDEQAALSSETSPAPANEYLSYIPLEGNEQKVFYLREQALVRMLIRYGEKVMCYLENENGEEQPLTVIECISSSLKEDELQMTFSP